MGKPGPTPKPTAIKVLEGNPGKRQYSDKEPSVPPLTEVPRPPSFLMPLAKKHWKKMAVVLRDCSLLTSIDLDSFAAYCNAYATWVDALHNLKKYGPITLSAAGLPIESPYVRIAEKALNRMLQYQKEFGLTPSSRVRVEVDCIDDNEFSEFLKNGE